MTIREILLDAGFVIAMESSDYYRTRPIYRNTDNPSSLSVHKETGKFHDFGTGQSGTIQELIKLVNGGSIDFKVQDRPANSVIDLKSEIALSFNKEEIKALLPSYTFYNKKGISTETLQLFQSGYCSAGKMHDRYVFPIINPDGSLVGLSGRNMRSEPTDPKWKALWIKWKHLGLKSKWIYPYFLNREIIAKEKEVIIVESHGNMLALWESGLKNSILCCGSSMSKDLLAAIIGMNPNRIIIGMDNDPGNNPGKISAMKIKKTLENWFDKSKIQVRLPPTGVDLSLLYEQSGKSGIEKWYENKI